MSGLIEIGQANLTTYRGGDWFDLLANICGVLAPTVFALLVIHPWIVGRKCGKTQD